MRRHGEQLAAHRADLRIELSGIDQRLDEIRQQQHVGIEGEHPFAARELDGLILSRGEADIIVVVVDLAAVFELFQNVDGAIGRGVIDDDYLFQRIPLGEYRFDAAFDETAAVICDYSYGYKVAVRHEKNLSARNFRSTSV